MVVFNQTFFDLNGKRGYCVDGADGLPPDTIADLKLSVPSRTETIWLAGLFLSGDSVRLTLTTVSQLVATFTSDQRSAIRPGEPYPLNGVIDGYGGLIVFGEGIRNDCDSRTPMRISEECLTRYEKSCIPFAAIPCRNERLLGEVRLTGTDQLLTDGINVPTSMFGTDRALRLALVDTGIADTNNPMIVFANGINGAYGGTSVFSLFGALPDATGTVTLSFDDHFHFAVSDDSSTLALGTDLSTDDVCRRLHDTEYRETEPVCPPSDITFDIIPYRDD